MTRGASRARKSLQPPTRQEILMENDRKKDASLTVRIGIQRTETEAKIQRIHDMTTRSFSIHGVTILA